MAIEANIHSSLPFDLAPGLDNPPLSERGGKGAFLSIHIYGTTNCTMCYIGEPRVDMPLE